MTRHFQVIDDRVFTVRFYLRREAATYSQAHQLEFLGERVVRAHEYPIDVALPLLATLDDASRGGPLDERAIQIHLLATGITVATYCGPDDEARLRYGIGNFGDALLFSDPVSDYVDSSSFGEVREVTDSGYVPGDPGEFVISYPEGRGGDGAFVDLAGWLLDQGVDLGIEIARDYLLFTIGGRFFRRLRNSRTDKRMRQIAIMWDHRDLKYPRQLREYFDSKAVWTADEVSRRLTISETSSQQLLQALGFQRNVVRDWIPGISKQSRKRRQKWIDHESDAFFGGDGSREGHI